MIAKLTDERAAASGGWGLSTNEVECEKCCNKESGGGAVIGKAYFPATNETVEKNSSQ